VLVGCAELRVINPVEVVLHDACFNYAAVQCVTVTRSDELVYKGCLAGFDLIIVAANNLLAPTRRRAEPIEEVIRAVQTIRSNVAVSIIVVGSGDHELEFMEAGAEGVITFPFNSDRLRGLLRQVLNIPETDQAVAEESQSGAGFWWRRLQKLVLN